MNSGYSLANTNFFNSINNGDQIVEEGKILHKIILDNEIGDFIPNNKLIINPHGLNVLKSVNKDGSYFFGTVLYEVSIILLLNQILNIFQPPK